MPSLAAILWIGALGALFYYMTSKGDGCCGSHKHNNHSDGDHKNQNNENAHINQQSQSQELNSSGSPAVQDPVCGMQINKVASAPASEHFGRTFHFCSEQCRKLFDINPGKYAGSV